MLETSCSAGTFVYCNWGHCIFGVISVVIVTVVMNSACGPHTDLCCMWESLFN